MSAMPQKGHQFKDIANQRFGRLIAMSRGKQNAANRAEWNCVCDCGNKVSVAGAALRSGNTKSCGCGKSIAISKAHTTHGHAKVRNFSRAYMIWRAMVSRCHTETNRSYKDYGARGISVCDAWRNSFEAFLADMGEPADGMSLERSKNSEGYSPGNCIWASRLIQANNTRANVMIETPTSVMTLAQFSRFTGIRYSNLRSKLARGVSTFAGIQIKAYKRGESA